MPHPIAPPPTPIIELWRIVALVLIVVSGSAFAHAITPSQPEAAHPSAAIEAR